MNLLIYILIFNFIGSVVSLIGGILLLLREDFAKKISPYLSSFAAGSLLGAALFDLLPEALAESKPLGVSVDNVFLFTLVGIIFFFLLERVLHWYHHHNFEEHDIKGKPVVSLLIVGDAVHNFIDGIAIASTFAISIPLGILTSFAVGAHEIPHEIGEFGVMLKYGYSRKKVLIINVLHSLSSFVGAFLAFYLGSKISGLTAIFLAISAGFFLYIALSDLVPEIHHQNKKGLAFWETLFLILGIVTIYFGLFIIRDVFKIGH